MDIVDEVARAIVGALKGISADGNPGALLTSLPEDERRKYQQAARDAIETYLAVVAIPLEVRETLGDT